MTVVLQSWQTWQSDFSPAGLMFLGSRAGTQVYHGLLQGWKELHSADPKQQGKCLAPAKAVVQDNILFADVGEKLQHLLFLLLKGP